MARFGIKYREAKPMLDAGMGGVGDVIDRYLAARRKQQDEEQIAKTIYADETTAPVTGTVQLNDPASGTRGDSAAKNTVLNPDGTMQPRGLPRGASSPLMASIYGEPTTQRRFRGLDEISPEDITSLMLMKSGEGERAVRALSTAKALKAPAPIDKNRFQTLSDGASLYDAILGKTVASNAKDQTTKQQFRITDYPIDVQQAYSVANNLNAQPADRQRAAQFFQERTGFPVTVAGKLPDAKDASARVRSVNGGLYFVSNEMKDGKPVLRELIPPGLSPAGQASVLQQMLNEDVIDEETYREAITTIASSAKVPGIKAKPGTGDGETGTPGNIEYDYVPDKGLVQRGKK